MAKDPIDLEDYESSFLERYIRKKAKSQVSKLEEQVQQLEKSNSDTLLIEKIKSKICLIEKEAEKNIEALESSFKKDKLENKDSFLQPEFPNRFENDNDEKSYFRNLNRYCKERGVDIKEINIHIRSGSHALEKLFIPEFLWDRLFAFQREGVEWMFGLFERSKGGILADEMGLGKTLQVICLVTSLFISERAEHVLVVCPATVIDHWVNEWKKVYSLLRICVFHRNKTKDMEHLFKSFKKTGGVGIFSYEGLKTYFRKVSSNMGWDYVVLDEGHRIKNRNSHISQYIKNIGCKNRLVLTGTPMQNNLAELWNLFDFVNPTLLGSYETFKEEFEDNIRKAGYTNASNVDVDVGFSLSSYLRKVISPYILRRSKKDVAQRLPEKVEKIVFCELSQEQVEMYKSSLNTESMFKVLQGKKNVLCGIDMLRKICNHPYLWSRDTYFLSEQNIVKSSGKMYMLNTLLSRWREEDRKVLVFSQTVGMLNILDKNFRYLRYSFLRMDGNTPVKVRSELVSKFNISESVFIFLLTTKVGGIGLNLVGASRVVIYDPDWNPSVDSQAKERVYRYGQVKDVEIYKLVCSSTIEEKILHTQIFKSMLDQKIFTNARLSRFFNKLDLDDLFTYTQSDKKAGKIEDVHQDSVGVTNSLLKPQEDDFFDSKKLVSFILDREEKFREP